MIRLIDILKLIYDPQQSDITIQRYDEQDHHMGSIVYHSIEDIPNYYYSYEVLRIFGYNAEGYDGLEITIRL